MSLDIKRTGETAKFHLYQHANPGSYVLKIQNAICEQTSVLSAIDIYALRLVLKRAESEIDA